MLCRQVLPDKNGVEQIYIIKTEKPDVEDTSGPLMEPEDVDIKEEPMTDDDKNMAIDTVPPAMDPKFCLQDFIIKEEPDDVEDTQKSVCEEPSSSIKTEKLEPTPIRDLDDSDIDSDDDSNSSEDEKKPDQSKIRKMQIQPPKKENGKAAEDSTKSDVERYDCEYCGKSYSMLKTLRRHLNLHSLEKVHTCKICGKKFDRALRLVEHEKVHSDDTPFKCKTCGKGFKFNFRLQRHKSVHTGEKPFFCRCGLAFRTNNNLLKHKYRCIVPEAAEITACRFCEASFASHPKMVTHVELEHTEVTKETKCQFCPAQFKHPIQLVIHEKQHQNPDIFSCEQCNRIFKHQSDLEKHMTKHSSEKRTYVCDVCGKIFGHSFYLILHKRSHTGTRPYTCDLCPKTFSHCSTKNRHRLTHFNNKSKNFIPNPEAEDEKAADKNVTEKVKKTKKKGTYTCDICGKTFNFPYNLTIHQRIHTGTRPYACDLCPSVFTDTSTKKRHRRTHFNSQSKNFIPNCKVDNVGENIKVENTEVEGGKSSATGGSKDVKFHLCETCGKAFKLPSRLNAHKRTHLKEKSFACHCGVDFKTITHLIKHQRQCILPEDNTPTNHPCRFCQKVFHSHSKLKAHVGKAHTKCTKEIKCQFCPSKFKRPVQLIVHEQKHQVPGVISCEQCNRLFKCPSDLDKHMKKHFPEMSSESPEDLIIPDSQVPDDFNDADIEVDSVIEVDYVEIDGDDDNQTKAETKTRARAGKSSTAGKRPIMEMISMEEYQWRKQQAEDEVL